MKKILGILAAILMLSGCIVNDYNSQEIAEAETYGETDYYFECVAESFTTNKQINEKTFNGCVKKNGTGTWYLDGVELTEEEFNAIVNN